MREGESVRWSTEGLNVLGQESFREGWSRGLKIESR
jgi:hypothetical protein